MLLILLFHLRLPIVFKHEYSQTDPKCLTIVGSHHLHLIINLTALLGHFKATVAIRRAQFKLLDVVVQLLLQWIDLFEGDAVIVVEDSWV